ncbi:16S rRNA (cytosine(1402)-N(4))-methyltransferase RsmH [Mesomycoplasma neurolyticum]|uniref:Ribosomal RNA small subunit methyltransferase H n=1 Tax=Mesomycoplasma neurolyticum TaxID=2120 RepID=A0A449A4Q9_9BACT|nr:16S rRNA (cytosine(1402)-N(4))-methyltransferase RsmH [Mesomycoplasma neurolyticum]VEU59241.1 S-adenosyl-methyltransferase MraW [Mesomycoplasma neurolyticum]
MKHLPVLLNEVLEQLNLKEDGKYIDLTLGRAGHSSHILKKLKTGWLYGFDKDIEATKESRLILNKINSNFTIIHSDFKNIKYAMNNLKVEKVDGILMDLGVSSPQLDDKDRGFSYNKDSRLDMRMDRSQSLDAHYIVNNYSYEQLNSIFIKNADVKLSYKVAKGIIDNRPINTTLELVDVIKKSLPAKIVRLKNPAKAIFQAIRIEVNDELESLKLALKDSINFLNTNGKLLVITFHSIEDKIVKNFFNSLTKKEDYYKLPIIVEQKWKNISLKPKNDEISTNNRSRSAKLRILTRLK